MDGFLLAEHAVTSAANPAIAITRSPLSLKASIAPLVIASSFDERCLRSYRSLANACVPDDARDTLAWLGNFFHAAWALGGSESMCLRNVASCQS